MVVCFIAVWNWEMKLLFCNSYLICLGSLDLKKKQTKNKKKQQQTIFCPCGASNSNSLLCTCVCRCNWSVEGNAGARSGPWCRDYIHVHPSCFPQHRSSATGLQGNTQVCVCACVCVCNKTFGPWWTCSMISVQDAGVSLESEGLLSSEVRMMANRNLAQLYTLCKYTHTHTRAFMHICSFTYSEEAPLHLEQPSS